MKLHTLAAGTLLLFCTAAALFAGGAKDTAADEQAVIRIASKPMTEQYILTEILKQLIEHDTDLTVEVTKGIGGGTTNIHPALLKGEFDLYPEYTGTAWAFIVGRTDIPADDQMYGTVWQELQKAYGELGLEWINLYGFENKFAIAVRNDAVQPHGITKLSQLAEISADLTFGANPDYYEKADGFTLLCDTYGLAFKETVDLDMGLKYTAIETGSVDAINAFTTDARLAVAPVTVLEDDRHMITDYYCGTIARTDTLEAHPELRAALAKMDGLITTEDMILMNAEVEINGKDEIDVAREFLSAKGLLNQR